MSTHLEWVHAGYTRPALMNAEDLGEYADDGNEAGDVGLYLGDSDGAVLYGTPDQLRVYLTLALARVNNQWPSSH